MDDDELMRMIAGDEEDGHQKKIDDLKTQIQRELETARKFGRAKDKENALVHLRKKKALEAELADYLEKNPQTVLVRSMSIKKSIKKAP